MRLASSVTPPTFSIAAQRAVSRISSAFIKRSINCGLMSVNPQFMAVSQPEVDNCAMQQPEKKLDTFGARFTALKDRSGLSYDGLALSMQKWAAQMGYPFSISHAALHKWAAGGGIEPENVGYAAEYFECNKVWLFFGEEYAPPPLFLAHTQRLKVVETDGNTRPARVVKKTKRALKRKHKK